MAARTPGVGGVKRQAEQGSRGQPSERFQQQEASHVGHGSHGKLRQAKSLADGGAWHRGAEGQADRQLAQKGLAAGEGDFLRTEVS